MNKDFLYENLSMYCLSKEYEGFGDMCDFDVLDLRVWDDLTDDIKKYCCQMTKNYDELKETKEYPMWCILNPYIEELCYIHIDGEWPIILRIAMWLEEYKS